MKFFFLISFLLILSNCSLNQDSKYWNEDGKKYIKEQMKLSKILKKTDDITEMTDTEYKFYIDDISKKSKYPDISK